VSLQGARELRARLKAIKEAWKPVARKWGRSDVLLMRARVPVKTGKLRRSFRVTSVSGKRVRVGGYYTAYFIDHGTKAHDITPKRARGLVFEAEGRTIFTRKVHQRGNRARPFRQQAAEEALRQNPWTQEVIDQWNSAA